ncbi:choice-of-anchor L domain-containing protein, partial [Mesonia aquimarina]|uniref:choice-of-anchor L domain-containing protein n=1 Tax=Mesonia aquimarina TaxID=1504967 RepID=UPI0013CEAC5B
MKKKLLLLLLFFGSFWSYGQIGIIENFESGVPGDWTSVSFFGTDAEACDGQSIRANLYEFNTAGSLVSPNIIGQSNATDLDISFDYKIVDFSAAIDATAPGWGEFVIDYSTDNGANWTTVETINDDNHVTSAECTTVNYTVDAADLPSGVDFQIRFSLTWLDGDYYFYIDNLLITQETSTPPNCDAVLINPLDGAVDVPADTMIEWSAATGIATGYKVSIGTTPGGVELEDQLDVGLSTTYTPAANLDYNETYYVTVIPYNENGDATGCTEESFTVTDPPPSGTICEDPIVATEPLPYITSDSTSIYGDDYSGSPGATGCGTTFSYLNGDDVIYSYTPTEDTTVDIILSDLSNTYAGVFIYTDCSQIGTECVAGLGNGSSTDDFSIEDYDVVAGTTYYIVISTWAAPQSVDYTLIIRENTCINPSAEYEVVGDCDNGPQFFVEVNITDLGDATDLTISDNQGSPDQTASATGVVTFGPYSNETDVEIDIENSQDANCFIGSPVLTQEYCSDVTVDCTVGPENTVFCYQSNETREYVYTSTDGNPLNLVINAGEVENTWDEFIVLDTDGTQLYNGYGDAGDLSDVGPFQSTGDQITIQVVADTVNSCDENGYTPIDVTISCATCINPQADYTVVSNCDSGNDEFFIDVDLTSLGDATSVTISDNQGNADQTASTIDVYTFGPYVNQTGVEISIENDDDSSCLISSSSLTQNYCPPPNDECLGAEIVLVNDGLECIEITSSTIQGATDSGYTDCGGTADDDVWFEFTATAESHAIALSNIQSTTSSSDLYHSVYEGTDCDNLSLLYCADGFDETSSLAENLTIGETYYISVYSSGDLEEDTTFDLCITTPGEPISVDPDLYTVEELVIDVLINNPCAQVSNITYSTGTDFGSTNGIGYFDATESNFPLESGLIMNSGDVSNSPGPESGGQSDGAFGTWPGDEDLTELIQDIEGNATSTSMNATVIEFDFVPFIDQISFNFLFASDEYGTYQCSFSDPFAFFLTDSEGNTTNLAVVPTTGDPIAVTTVRNEAYNTACGSVNEEFFSTFYGAGGSAPVTAPIDYMGHTVSMVAQSEVTPGEQYHIKLAIADRNDSSFDSGVFLEAGSFDIGGIDLGQDITLENGNVSCEGDPIILDTGIVNTENATIEWYKEGELIDGENGPTLEVTEEGDYAVAVVYFGQCGLTDVISVEFYDPLDTDLGPDQTVCNQNEVILDATPLNAEDFGNIMYTWFLDDTELTGETMATLQATQPGIYTVEVSGVIIDSNGDLTNSLCEDTDEVELLSAGFTVSLGSDQDLCDESSYTIESVVTGEDASNASYVWEDSNG